MKPVTLKPIINRSIFAFLFLVLAGCSGEQGAPSESIAEVQDDTAVEHALKHTDSKYVCPMHPQIVSDKPGDCPICGMKLVKKGGDPKSSGSTEKKEPLYYRHPMKPEITSDKPMKDEMGMDYVPVYPADNSDNAIQISPEIVQNMGVRTEPVKQETLWKYIKAVGYIGYDEDKLTHVHARTNGWIEKLHVHAQGERVERGQALLEFYSPEIVSAQEELLITARSRSDLLPTAKNRLQLLDVPMQTIEEVLRTNKSKRSVPILSPLNGVVGMLGVRHGMYIEPGTELFAVADLSEVWVKVSVFDHQLNWVQTGRPAEISVSALPGKLFEGKVDYIYPELDPVSRTLQVRLKFDNPDGLLQPNMFADVVIYGGPKENALSVSREAVIFSGNEERVIKALGEGRFEPATVTIGMQTPKRIEILDGLKEGDLVVTSAQFLIDSEAGLQSSFKRMQPITD